MWLKESHSGNSGHQVGWNRLFPKSLTVKIVLIEQNRVRMSRAKALLRANKSHGADASHARRLQRAASRYRATTRRFRGKWIVQGGGNIEKRLRQKASLARHADSNKESKLFRYTNTSMSVTALSCPWQELQWHAGQLKKLTPRWTFNAKRSETHNICNVECTLSAEQKSHRPGCKIAKTRLL